MKYALIGCGRISTNHIRAAVHNSLEIAGVCDIVGERMEAVLAKNSLNTDSSIARYHDYEQMLKDLKPDLVSIATEAESMPKCHFLHQPRVQRHHRKASR